jgi:hypothetical protein
VKIPKQSVQLPTGAMKGYGLGQCRTASLRSLAGELTVLPCANLMDCGTFMPFIAIHL